MKLEMTFSNGNTFCEFVCANCKSLVTKGVKEKENRSPDIDHITCDFCMSSFLVTPHSNDGSDIFEYRMSPI